MMNKDESRTEGKAVREIDCDEVMRQLFDFLDDEVDMGAHEEIHQHIEDCRSCFSRVEFERELKGRVQGAGQAAAPKTLERRLSDLMRNLGLDDQGQDKDKEQE
jgi:anti-sigma factor (TIGR02949 family)